MTLINVIEAIEASMKKQPAIHTICRENIYKLDARSDIDYGVGAWVQGTHSYIGNGLRQYKFTLYYVDRLTFDKSNEQEVESVGMDIIDNIVRALPDSWEIGSYNYVPFGYKFTDECAGVWADITLTIPIDWTCPSVYPSNDVKVL